MIKLELAKQMSSRHEDYLELWNDAYDIESRLLLTANMLTYVLSAMNMLLKDELDA